MCVVINDDIIHYIYKSKKYAIITNKNFKKEKIRVQ